MDPWVNPREDLSVGQGPGEGLAVSLDDLAARCQRIGDEIRLLVAALRQGQFGEEGFVIELLRIEAGSAAAHGFSLCASHTFDDWTVITVRSAGSSKPCAAFEVNLRNGDSRPVGTPCRRPDPAAEYEAG